MARPAVEVSTAEHVHWRDLAMCGCQHPARDHSGQNGTCLWCGCEEGAPWS